MSNIPGSDLAGISPSISAYDLRHSAITLQVERGHPAHKIADWAGTSERMIADVYRHKLQAISDLGPVS
jgi:integrase